MAIRTKEEEKRIFESRERQQKQEMEKTGETQEELEERKEKEKQEELEKRRQEQKDINKLKEQGETQRGAERQVKEKRIEEVRIETGLSEIQEKEVSESEALRQRLVTSGEELERVDRLAKAGFLTIAEAGNMMASILAGKEVKPIEINPKKIRGINRAFAAIVGGLATADIPFAQGFSVASLFGFKNQISALSADISQNRETTEATLRGVRDGANVQQGIKLIETLQDSIKNLAE